MTTLHVGDVVRFSHYGEAREGTITRIGRGVVFVAYAKADGTLWLRWLHLDSVAKVGAA